MCLYMEMSSSNPLLCIMNTCYKIWNIVQLPKHSIFYHKLLFVVFKIPFRISIKCLV